MTRDEFEARLLLAGLRRSRDDDTVFMLPNADPSGAHSSFFVEILGSLGVEVSCVDVPSTAWTTEWAAEGVSYDEAWEILQNALMHG